jgi:hypothetical protein
VVGLVAGGLVSGVVLGLLSGLSEPVPPVWRSGAVVVIAVAALLREVGVLPVPLPQNTRQVPPDVLRRALHRGALQFGFELGTGVRTYVSASAPYVVALAVLLLGQDLRVAMLAGIGFGLGRAATPLSRLASGDVVWWDAMLRRRIRLIAIAGAALLVLGYAVMLTPR